MSSSKIIRHPGGHPLRFLVGLAAGANPAAVAAELTARCGGTVLHVYQTVLLGFAVQVASEEQIACIAADPRVERVEQDQDVGLC